MDDNVFNNATGLIISQIEGGYYHPNMLGDGRVKDSRYNTSGETMFGIDRKQGGTINDTPAGKKFWKIIDDAGAADNWKWNYNGGPLAPQLKDLAAEMMKPVYMILADKTLSPEARAIVESSPDLLLHFIYAAWNGAGWFKKFAGDVNTAVKNGVTDPGQLSQVAKDSRLLSSNSLIKQGGAKIAALMDSLKGRAAEAVKAVKTEGSALKSFIKKYPWEIGIGLGLIGIGITIYFGTSKKGNGVPSTKQQQQLNPGQ